MGAVQSRSFRIGAIWAVTIFCNSAKRSRNVMVMVGILFHPGKLFQRFSTNATGSASGNGGLP
jgi:hypothetical protein